MPNPQDVADLYDGVAARYNESVARTNYIVPSWFDKQLEEVSLRADLHFLDLGCANGIHATRVFKSYPDFAAVGVDISPKMAAEARQTGLYEKVMVHDLSQPLTFLESGRFDLAIAFGCIEFVLMPQICLNELSRLLRPNGLFMMSFQLFVDGRSDAPRTMRSGKVIHHAYSREEISRMIQVAGLEMDFVEELTGYTGGAPCPYLMVRGRKSTLRQGETDG